MDDSAADHFRAPLLLHSLAEFKELLFACFDAAGVQSVAEVGAEDGHFTREVLTWARENSARVVAIDPFPGDDLLALVDANDDVELLAAPSVEALEKLDRVDAYMIDGDHNYFTVSSELELIADRAADAGDDATFPLVVLHDVGWPCGRRDMYYAPDVIPEASRHPYTYDAGVVPGVEGVVDGGFNGAGEFAFAEVEGGPRNGVQTAVDDFMAAHPALAYHRVPAVFGLGVLHPADAPYASAVTELLEPFIGGPLVERLEDNRIELYLALLRLQFEADRAHAQTKLALEQALLHIRDLQSENTALWARQSELESAASAATGAAARFADELRMTRDSRALRLADTLARLRTLGGRAAEGPSARERITQALDEFGY
jgi:hypothetical protein